MQEKIEYPWGHKRPFNDYSSFIRRTFSERVQKLSINAGFTCPNRDGSKGKGGCTYCYNPTFNPDYCKPQINITEQIEKGIKFFAKKYKTQLYFAYFQAYSNTYGDIKLLKRLYSEALAHPKVIGLVIATRPDCLTDEIVDYLTQLSEKYYLIVELGIESTNNETLEKVNRKHTYEDTVNAIETLAANGIKTGGHLILGLPDESKEQMIEHATKISKLPLNNLKLHQLQIQKHTQLGREYEANPHKFKLFEPLEYIELCVDFLEVLSPQIVIERFASESPLDLLLAPRWGGYRNYELVTHIEKTLIKRGAWQGCRLMS